MEKYIITVKADGVILERLALSDKDEAEQVASALDNLTDYYIECSWEKVK